MISYRQYINESKEDKNVHLEHVEDLILTRGVSGARDSLNFLGSLRNMLAGHASRQTLNLSSKWDGAPAVICGINPDNDKFFVGTKGVFAQNPKLNYTEEDIDKNHPGDGLNKKLKLALRYLPELGIKNVVQGDMMFTKEDLKKETIDGVDYITFHPNTVVYAVPENTGLAKQILSAQLGIVWHTTYTGKSWLDMKASFGADVARMNQTKNVWFRDASFVDASGTATFTLKDTEKLNEYLSQAGNLFRTISPRVMNEIATNETYRIQIMAWNNTKVREGKTIDDTAAHVQALILHVEDKLNRAIQEAKKQDTRLKRQQEKTIILNWYKSNRNELKKILDFQNLLVSAKMMIIRKLEQVKGVIGTFLKTDDGFKVTNEEGFVAADILSNKAIKLVDRLTFSQANFNATKNWIKT
jgi:hypothetical protein